MQLLQIPFRFGKMLCFLRFTQSTTSPFTVTTYRATRAATIQKPKGVAERFISSEGKEAAEEQAGRQQRSP